MGARQECWGQKCLRGETTTEAGRGQIRGGLKIMKGSGGTKKV